MAKIKVRTFDRLKPCAPDPDETTGIAVTTEGVLAAADDPIQLRLHHLAAGGGIAWHDSKRGHLAFVWEGAVAISGRRLGAGSMILVEHGGSASAVAEEGATLLVFNCGAAFSGGPEKAGGRVHLLAEADVPRADHLGGQADVGAAMFADSDCETCALWLHGNDFHEADFVVAPHFHSEDEVIVVTGGEIVLGDRPYGRGTAIAIAANTVYGFRTGPRGLSFINFRPGRPSYGLAGARETIDERGFYTAIPSPRYADA